MYGYIYKITNKLNGKIYIGKREKSVFDESYWGSGKYITNAINKYGKENFSREIITWEDSKAKLCEKETFYIAKYNATDLRIGYNIAKNGFGGGFPHTEEWKKAHSGPGNGRYHKEVSQETRDKISKANKGKKRSEEFKKRVSETQKGRAKPEGFGDKVSRVHKGKQVSEVTREKLRIARTGKKCGRIYNNGVNERHIKDGDVVPDGFVLGRLLKGRATHKNNLKNKHWYNDGVKEKYFNDSEVPHGWIKGRLKREDKKNK